MVKAVQSSKSGESGQKVVKVVKVVKFFCGFGFPRKPHGAKNLDIWSTQHLEILNTFLKKRQKTGAKKFAHFFEALKLKFLGCGFLHKIEKCL